MFGLRKFPPVVVLALGACLAAVSARAQGPFTCSTSVASVPVRAEGLAELVGDLTINCTGGIAGQTELINVQLFANTNITGRILQPVTNLTEALLGVDSPPWPVGKIYAGRLVTRNSVIFSGVSISLPGSANRTLHVRNVRVNATTLSLGSAVTLFVTASGAGGSIPITNPQVQVAVVQTGLSFEVRKTDDSAAEAPTLLTCTGNNATLLTGGDYPPPPAPGGRTFNLKFKEGFTNAFRKKVEENGYNDPGLQPPLDRAGLADHGTRLRAVFSDIPVGVTLFVTVQPVLQGTSPGVQAQCTTTAGGALVPCPVNSPADGGLYRVPASGEVYWEITASAAGTAETVSFGVAVAYNPGVPAGMGKVLGSFSPISTAGEATAGPDDLPRFISTYAPVPAFILETCRTVLLFQFITSVPGFDTGIAVTNTTWDSPVFNTPGQSGKCRAYFFQPGVTVPPLESPVLPPGGQWLWTLWSYKPNFQGYMLVSCDFQYAYGYAFISDLGFSGPDRFAQSYQALVLSDRTRSAAASILSAAGATPR
jgi:hypothetical protein